MQAADAHMSVGKMEMFSSAAAKMTKSAVACELTGAEIWKLAKTTIELFGASVSRFANKFTSYGIDSTLIVDLTARRDDGQFWDLGTKEGSAPCISFRTLLHSSEKGTKEQIEKAQDEQRQYTQACIKAYERQLSMGGHFLHEHPVHASSWCMPEMRELLSDGRIHLVQGLMCHWRMAATDDRIEHGLVRGKSRWATNSSSLATLLAREHAAEWDKCGSDVLTETWKEVLNTLGKQLVDDGRLDSVSLCSDGPPADFPELDAQEWQEYDYDQQGNPHDPLKVKEGKKGNELGVEAKAL